MEWELLFSLQRELDTRIKKEHNLEKENVVTEKVLALLVELGELANETRCFKFWSKKGPNEKAIILEEYVDGLHFIISLGIEMEYTFHYEKNVQKNVENVTTLFIKTYEQTLQFHKDKSKKHYEELFHSFLQIGSALELDWEMIHQAYINKNDINHARQNQGY